MSQLSQSDRCPAHLPIEASRQLFERARQVIPGGIYGHATPALVAPGASPYYAHRADGARYWDVDGNEFIDLMCAYGPVVLGYRHPAVEAACERQSALGDCLNHPAPVMVDLAERLVSLIDFADWGVFGKNGSDMTTWCMQVAREHTGKKKILCVEGAYHGIGAWCTPGHGGLIDEDSAHVHRFRWNDGEGFDALLSRYVNQVAAVVVTPYHHPLFAPSEMPAPGFLVHIQSQCARHGMVFILDDIRAGFRLHMGGSHRCFDFEPDMGCYSKAMGNGHPISAALGRSHLRRAAERVFLTGSYWNSAVAMAAALETLDTLEREESIARIARMGRALASGLRGRAEGHGLEVEVSGPPACPFLTFRGERGFFSNQKFAVECLRRGVFLHPHHNWFVSAALTLSDIDRIVEVADAAFERVARGSE